MYLIPVQFGCGVEDLFACAGEAVTKVVEEYEEEKHIAAVGQGKHGVTAAVLAVAFKPGASIEDKLRAYFQVRVRVVQASILLWTLCYLRTCVIRRACFEIAWEDLVRPLLVDTRLPPSTSCVSGCQMRAQLQQSSSLHSSPPSKQPVGSSAAHTWAGLSWWCVFHWTPSP